MKYKLEKVFPLKKEELDKEWIKVDTFDFKKANNPCENCSNNPKNGGSGICLCTLNLPQITC